MLIELTHNEDVPADAALYARIENDLRARLGRFEGRVTTLVANLMDMNAVGGGGSDKRVSLAVRPLRSGDQGLADGDSAVRPGRRPGAGLVVKLLRPIGLGWEVPDLGRLRRRRRVLAVRIPCRGVPGSAGIKRAGAARAVRRIGQRSGGLSSRRTRRPVAPAARLPCPRTSVAGRAYGARTTSGATGHRRRLERSGAPAASLATRAPRCPNCRASMAGPAPRDARLRPSDGRWPGRRHSRVLSEQRCSPAHVRTAAQPCACPSQTSPDNSVQHPGTSRHQPRRDAKPRQSPKQNPLPDGPGAMSLTDAATAR
jgi:hypothetical protein